MAKNNKVWWHTLWNISKVRVFLGQPSYESNVRETLQVTKSETITLNTNLDLEMQFKNRKSIYIPVYSE